MHALVTVLTWAFAFPALQDQTSQLPSEDSKTRERAGPGLKIAAAGGIVGGGPRGTVLLASSDGASCVRLGGARRAMLAHRFSWSPDGRRIAYAVGHRRYGLSDVYLLDLETEKEKEIAVGIPGPFRPVWSWDSRKVAFARMRTKKDLEFCVYSIDRAALEPPRERDRKMWSWSGDGAHIVERWIGYVGSDGPGGGSGAAQGFLHTPVDMTFLELLQITGPIITSVDERRVFFFGDLRNGYTTGVSSNRTQLPLRMLDRKSGEIVTLAEKVPGIEFEFFRNSPCVSPDGKHVSFLRCTAAGEEVSVIDIESRRERRLGAGHSPAWSFDGLKLAYERTEGGTRIVDLKTGKEIVLKELGSPSFAPPEIRPAVESRERSRR